MDNASRGSAFDLPQFDGVLLFSMSQPPTTLGQYEIIREIARSNDIVYEAYDSRMNRRVAVKELAIPAGSTEPQVQDRIARFRREAQAVGSLNHPNIMTVYAFAEDAGRWYIAMEFLDGTTLRKEIETAGVIEMERAVRIVSETLDGLGHAHANGVVHRDIKPDNVQIVSGGQVKITDFGIARLTFQPNLTMDGQVFGTPSYMSPEQVVGKEIDARSDLFSVGAMLFEMLAGVKPFAGDNVVSITYNIVNTAPVQPGAVPNAIWAVIERALDKAPSARYGSALEMRDALQAALAATKAPPPVAVAPWSLPAATGAPPPVFGTQGAAPPIVGAPFGYGAGSGGTFQTQGYGPMTGLPNPAHMPPSYTNAPIYYPPPPRTPVISPEASRTIGRFLAIAITLGLLFAAAFYAFATILGSVTDGGSGRTGVRRQEAAVAGGDAKPDVATDAKPGAAQARVAGAGGAAGFGGTIAEAERACARGDAAACGTLDEEAKRLARSGRERDLEEAYRLEGTALTGFNRGKEAVTSYLASAQLMIRRGAERGEVRERIAAAEDAATLEIGYSPEIEAFKSQNGY